MPNTSLDRLIAQALSRRLPPARIERATFEATALEHARGVVRAGHVRATEYVATEALQAVAGLTDLESLYLQRAPLGEARYRMIVDTATAALANIVADTGAVMMAVISLLIGLVLFIMLPSAILGYQWSIERLRAQQAALDEQRRALLAEWDALDSLRRVRRTFFTARQAMRQQADTFGDDR